MKPDASKYRPDPAYLRSLLDAASLSQRDAAKIIGISERAMRYYLADSGKLAPYSVQFALEALAKRPKLSER